MSNNDVTRMLQEISNASSEVSGTMLSNLTDPSTQGDADFVSQVMNVYQQTMSVYGPVQAVYESVLQTTERQDIGSLSSSVNR